MIGLASSLTIGTLSLLVFVLVWRKATVSARELPACRDVLIPQEQGKREACPAEMVSKIFSREDREFVCSLQCSVLKELFQAERKSLALLWVQQTSQGIQKIMREHTELTGRSRDLEFGTEMKILFQYAELRLTCGFLLLFIELAGPFWLRSVALYVSKVSERLGQTHEALLAVTEPREAHRVDLR